MEKTGLPSSTNVILCSGRAQEYKGFQVLMEAAQSLSARRAELAFVHCGDGPYLPTMRELARETGLNNFDFLGARPDVPQLLSSATIAVIPSLWAEAFGLTVVEAMAAGVPLIASRIGGIPELVDDGETGLLVPPGDAGALQQALTRLLDDAALRKRLATAALKKAHAEFGIERVVADLSQIVLGELALPSTAQAPAAARAVAGVASAST